MTETRTQDVAESRPRHFADEALGELEALATKRSAERRISETVKYLGRQLREL